MPRGDSQRTEAEVLRRRGDSQRTEAGVPRGDSQRTEAEVLRRRPGVPTQSTRATRAPVPDPNPNPNPNQMHRILRVSANPYP